MRGARQREESSASRLARRWREGDAGDEGGKKVRRRQEAAGRETETRMEAERSGWKGAAQGNRGAVAAAASATREGERARVRGSERAANQQISSDAFGSG